MWSISGFVYPNAKNSLCSKKPPSSVVVFCGNIQIGPNWRMLATTEVFKKPLVCTTKQHT